jgi:hypothetical protein
MSVVSVPKLTWLVILVGTLGFALGYLSAPAHATTIYSIRVNPGGSVQWLTCTWHGTNGCGAAGDGELDWRGGGIYADTVYFRGWNYRSGSYGTIGSVETEDASGTCYSALATVENTVGGVVGKVEYTHTDIDSAGAKTWNLFGDPDAEYQTEYITNVVDDELTACKNANLWEAAHLHQGHDGSFTHASSNFTTVGTESIYGINDWQYYDSWSY